jgi:5'(3')-deoxyribonucleotidase
MKNSKHRVGIDVDGVVGNYTQMYLNAVRAATKREIPEDWVTPQWDLDEALGLTDEEKKATYRLVEAPDVALWIAPYTGAVAGVKKLAKIADVFFVTSPVKGSKTWCYDRTAWLKKHFGEELADSVHYTSHKYTFAADLFIDDKPSNCEEWQAAWPDGKALLWTANYSSSFLHDRLTHVQDWEQVARWVAMSPPTKYKPVVREE